MEPDDCPPWIESGNAFRLIIKVAKYSLADYDGVVEMDDQEHELWLDRSVGYSLAQFHEDMATKMIWGPSQALAIWVLDSETVGSEWRIRRDEHWQQVIKDRWEVRMAYIAVEVTTKDGYETNNSSVSSRVNNSDIPPRSGVTNVDASNAGANSEGIADTCTSPAQDGDVAVAVDWATLTIMQEEAQDGEANAIADEDAVYESMGFQAAHESAEEAAREEFPIPVISNELQREMEDAAIPVDDAAPTEPMADWDMDYYSVDNYYSVERFQAAYDGIVANITDKSQWPEVDKGFHLHPPIGKKRGPGRQVKNRKKPATERSGKATRQAICKGCGELGHRQGSWRCSLTGTKKRKRTKKTSVRPGRKKSKTGDIPAPEQATPRTRLAAAKEAALRARLQAEEAQLRASEAMEAAEAAARAANRELPAEPLPIEFQLAAPPTPSGPSTRRRLLLGASEPVPEGEQQVVEAVPKKMTPKRKQLSSKIKKK